MKRSVIYLLFPALILVGCNNQEKEAKASLENAKNMYEQDELFAAKNMIDSIRIRYPKQIKVLKESLELMRLVELKEANRNIAYCDSLIPVKQEELKDLTKNFVFEKDTVYEEIGNYIWKQQTVERNVERNYVRCGVNEKGEMYLASVYFGSRPVNHTGIKVSIKDDFFSQTISIPYDGGINYRFRDLGNVTEVVTYKGDKGVDAIKFICDNERERIKVEYTGGNPYAIYMADGDKKAVIATYHLAGVLSDIETMIMEKDKALKKKEYLEKKLEQ